MITNAHHLSRWTAYDKKVYILKKCRCRCFSAIALYHRRLTPYNQRQVM